MDPNDEARLKRLVTNIHTLQATIDLADLAIEDIDRLQKHPYGVVNLFIIGHPNFRLDRTEVAEAVRTLQKVYRLNGMDGLRRFRGVLERELTPQNN